MRIPVWPGVRLSVWEKQDPGMVEIKLRDYRWPFSVRRILSKRGWMLLLIRYDWQELIRPPEQVRVAAPPPEPVIRDFIAPPKLPEAELEELRRRPHP